MKYNKLIAILLIMTFLSSCAIAKYKYFPTITGQVLKDDEPIENAEITFILMKPGEDIKHYAMTNEDGYFSIPEISGMLFHGPTRLDGQQLLIISADSISYAGILGERDFSQENEYDEGYALNIVCDIQGKPETRTIMSLNGNWYRLPESKKFKYLDGKVIGRNDVTYYYEYNGICSPK